MGKRWCKLCVEKGVWLDVENVRRRVSVVEGKTDNLSLHIQ